MTLKSITKSLLGTLLLVAASTSVKAQSPSISSGGVIAYDNTTPMPNRYYWSIYGSNLSTVTQSEYVDGCPYGVSSYVYFAWWVYHDYPEPDAPFYEVLNNGGTNKCDGNDYYFYESGSLINFYAWAFTYIDQYGYAPAVTQYGWVTVYDSLGLGSNTQAVTFDPRN